MPFEVGQRVGDYEVQRMLGVGGMGHVYLVRNIISNRTEAMKVLLPDLTSEPDLAMRFISEIRTLAGFDHPNIAQLRTAFQAHNQLIMIMEYVEGYTMEQLATQKRTSNTEIVDYVAQALSALAYAHQHGVVHRDIKPANLMVTSHGVVKLMDFGIAKSAQENMNHTRPGTTIGSLHYMSPEQVRGGTVDARSDLYSIGIVLYELLAGRRPFESETTFSLLNDQLNTLPRPPIELNPDLPQGLNQIILTALAKDPADRFQDAEAFRTALRPFRATPDKSEAVAIPVPGGTAPTMLYDSPAPAPAPAAAVSPQPWGPPTSIPAAGPLAAGAAAAAAGAVAATPAYANVPNQAPRNPGYAPMPMPAARASGGNKTLWIATGAIAVVLALVGVGYAFPRFFHASAKSGTETAATTPEPVTTTTAPEPAPVTTQTLPPPAQVTPSNTTAPASSQGPSSNVLVTSARTPLVSSANSPRQNAGPGPSAPPVSSNPQANTQPPADHAALEDVQNRLIDLRARAGTDSRAVAQIRSQQEASGLGMRGDVESADSRLGSYMRAAEADVQRGNAAKATSDLDKAESELATLEKFLGR